MEGTPEKEDALLVCIGCKYNNKNVLTFILTRGDVKTTYAKYFDFGLEKKWVAYSGYLQLYTTILGMTMTDTWKKLKKRGQQ